MFNVFGKNPDAVSAEDLKNAIDTKQVCMILDVRSKMEYAGGHIAGAILIPVDEIANGADSKLSDKNALIYVYCASGGRSAMAQGILKKLGYSNTKNVQGGISTWKSKKFPITL
jgi:phage shock protein E